VKWRIVGTGATDGQTSFCRTTEHEAEQGGETGDRRQGTGNRRQGTGDREQETGNRRQGTEDRRQGTEDRRQGTGGGIGQKPRVL